MGKIIVIEGLDGCGKQTQSEKLYQRLKEENYPVMKIAYPRYENPSSSLVKMYLSGEFGKNPNEISPYIASTFYAVDRYASYKQDYEEFYKNGGILILDRYVTANMVHQAGKIDDIEERDKFLKWLWDFEFNLFGIPVPDKVFFLNIPPEVSQKLMAERENKFSHEKEKDIHESNKEYLNKMYTSACYLIEKFNWDEINCTKDGTLRSIEDIHKEIYEKAMQIL
ncbi:MAG: deoxynucleoside kinase [Clostridia bacterium]|nr:deoxynucleoside kinase [Clostridia bacterium]